MAIDVLKFNELKRQNNNYKSTSGYNTSLNTYNALLSCYNTNLCALATQRTIRCGAVHPGCSFYTSCVCTLYSSPFPSLSSPTGGFKVCDTSICFNQGVCCQWTVPAGITQIRFQLWGAGAPSAASKCCGGSMHGGTGAYASVIIPAVTGATYTICAGCAWWPGANCVQDGLDISPYSGCASFVTGCGLQSFCAEGGEASMLAYAQRMHNCLPALSGYTRLLPLSAVCDAIAGAAGSTQWPGICSNSSYCFRGQSIFTLYPSSYDCLVVGQYRDDLMRFLPSCKTFYGSTQFSNTYVMGLPGMFQFMSFDPSHYGTMIMPTIYGLSAAAGVGPFTISFDSGTCGGCLCSSGAPCLICNFGTALPSMGGVGTHSMGGSCASGAPGKMGMVCVQYQ